MTERKRRPHYQERRAHADGWEIEHRMITMQFAGFAPTYWNEDGWRPVFNHPDFDNPNLEFHIVPDADGWLPWYGSEDGKGPLEGNPMVEAEFSDHQRLVGTQGNWTWGSGIKLYRPHQEPAEKPKVKMWQWIYRCGNEVPGITAHFYKDMATACKAVPSCDVIGPAPWTEIEI